MVELSVEIIVFEILTRVPPKVVGRSKSVCKAWYVLLSGHNFVRAYCSCSLISSNHKALLIDDLTCSIHPINFQSHDYGPATMVTIPFDHLSYDHQFNDFSILSHWNGLLCVCVNRTFELILWNPLTTTFKRLSSLYSNGFYKDNLDVVGLYIDSHDDFKVLQIRRRDGALGVYVYSRSEESWRNIPLIIQSEYLSPHFYWSSFTLCGDTLYFTVSECWVGGRHFVICFDGNSEEFKEMSLPPISNDAIAQVVLVNVKNELRMFVATSHCEMTIDLWILQGEY